MFKFYLVHLGYKSDIRAEKYLELLEKYVQNILSTETMLHVQIKK